MVREIVIGGVAVRFKASGALPIVYRRLVGRDFFADMNGLASGSDKLLDFAWVMHRCACPDDTLEEEEWLEQFDFAEMNNACMEVVNMLVGTQATTSTAKKKIGK